MAGLHDLVVALRVFGDDLVPDEITRLLGADPTNSYSQGDEHVGGKGRVFAPRRTGAWIVGTEHQSPGDFDRLTADLLGRMTPDLSVWHGLSARFQLDLYCGLFLALTNEVSVLSAQTLKMLGDRGVELILEIYAPHEEPALDKPCPCYSGQAYKECHGYRGT